jgi:hypothetical protein
MRSPALLVALLVLGLAVFSGSVAGAGPVVLSGHVEHLDGQPFAGAHIVIYDTDANVAVSSVLTDANGNFSQSAADGRYTVSASYPAYGTNISYSGISSSTSDLDFALYEIQGTVVGSVTDGNTTLKGVNVTLSNSLNSYSTFTKSLGRFTIENVTAGTYIAYASMDGYDSGSGIYPDPVVVTKGGMVELNFTLTELINQPAKLGGKVTFNEEPLQGVKVVLSPLEGADRAVYTDAQGNYTFGAVTPGEYELLLSKSGYIGTSQKITLEPLKEKSVDVNMKKDSLPGNSGFLMDYDLSHSLMILALGLALFTTLTALFIRYRAGRKPEILETEDDED